MSDEVDDFLEHHGVMGMHWGTHGGGKGKVSTGAPGKSRSELKSLDKASKASDNKKHSDDVQAARDRYKATARSDYKTAKSQYKIDKHVIGKREASKVFDKVKEKNQADYEKSQEAKNGKEAARRVIATVALTGIASFLQG